MSEKATSADNQQGSRSVPKWMWVDPSETTRRAPLSDREMKAYLLGVLHDATLNGKRRVRFSQKGVEWLELLKCLLERIGHRSWIYQEGKGRSVYVLETVAVFLDFQFDPLKLESKKEKVCYVKGFFDAEGGIPRTSDRFYIQLVQSDRIKLEKLKKILRELGISVGKIYNPSKKVDPNYWRMYVLASSQKRFAKIIGSLHPRKMSIFRQRMMI